MVHVYIANVAGLTDPLEYPDLMKELPEDRVNKIKKLRQLKDRKQSLGAGFLLLTLLKRSGKSLDELCYEENGKPSIQGFSFNLSHSGDMVACAVSEKTVGIDIEGIKEMKADVAGRFFTSSEREHLEQYEGDRKEEEFFRLWTMKESYMKYTGEGMKLALDRFEFRFENKVSVYRDGHKVNCHIKEYNVPGYKMTVCAEENEFEAELEEIYL